MYGVVTRNVGETDWSAFERTFYEVKGVTGKAAEPIEGATNVVSCFADNAAVREETSLVAVDADGNAASDERESASWTHICPTNPDYREGLIEIIADCTDVSDDVRLDNVGFPGPGFCRCDRCDRQFAESEFADRARWRGSVLQEFLAEATATVPGTTYLSVHPDPYPGHLFERSGIDPAAAAEYVGEFVVPLYDPGYETTYWLESIAAGFADELEVPFGVELYAVEQDIDSLLAAVDAVDQYADHVYFGYDAGTAAAAIRRRDADRQRGVSHFPD